MSPAAISLPMPALAPVTMQYFPILLLELI
jgi:hypothetical protein